MKKAYPPDFEPLEQLSLDCLTGAGDSSTGVQWRSEFEEQLMLSVPGWTEDAKKSRTFHTLQEVLQCGDVFLQQCFATLQSYGLSLQRKLSVLAAKLQCTPSIPGVAEAMSTRLLSTPQDTEEMELNRYVCRLCDFQCADKEVLQEHIKDAHSNDTEVARAWVEYRKKVVGLLHHAGPSVSWRLLVSFYLLRQFLCIRCSVIYLVIMENVVFESLIFLKNQGLKNQCFSP